MPTTPYQLISTNSSSHCFPRFVACISLSNLVIYPRSLLSCPPAWLSTVPAVTGLHVSQLGKAGIGLGNILNTLARSSLPPDEHPQGSPLYVRMVARSSCIQTAKTVVRSGSSRCFAHFNLAHFSDSHFAASTLGLSMLFQLTLALTVAR
jgi:hypothetical protein